jgi:hypothetical protein
MLRIVLVIALVFAGVSLTAMPATGNYSSIQVSPVTGDEFGVILNIKKERDIYSIEFAEISGGGDRPTPRDILSFNEFKCDKSSTVCLFVCHIDPNPMQNCTLTKIPNGLIFTREADKVSHLLMEERRVIKTDSADEFTWAKGDFYAGPSRGSGVVMNLRDPAPVELVNYTDTEDGPMVEVEYQQKKLFVDYENSGATFPVVITGDRVRFRKSPSTGGEIISQFSRHTVVGGLYPSDDGKWLYISYRGNRGWVSSEFAAK